MNAQNLGRLIDDFRNCQDNLLRTKGNDYTMANEDRCHNFKVVAEMLGITPMQAWGVYYLKHVLAIATFVKFGKVESEGIYERFVDANNYSYLGLALIEDQKNEEAARNLAEGSSTQETVQREAVPEMRFDGPVRSDISPESQFSANANPLHGRVLKEERGIYRGL